MPSAYERQHLRERAARFEREYVELLASHSLPRVHAALLPLLPGLPPPPSCTHAHSLSDARRDRLLLHQLKRGLIAIVSPFEVVQVAQASQRITRGWLRCTAALQRHVQNVGGGQVGSDGRL